MKRIGWVFGVMVCFLIAALLLPQRPAAAVDYTAEEIWDKVSAENQKLLRSYAQKYYDEYIESSKKGEAKATELLKKAGLQVVRSTPAKEALRNKVAKEVQESLVGKVFSRELLNKTLALLEEYRKSHPSSEVVKLK